jgi:hypothetical protein
MSGPFGSTAWMANPASGFYDFNINNSLRLESASETLLEKTNAASGGSAAQIATLSCWFKYDVSDIESSQMPLIWNDSDASGISFAQSSNTPHQLYVYWGGQGASATTRVFRDPNAWYHVVAEIDSTQGTEANRLKIYVNGVATPHAVNLNQNTTSAFFNNNVKQRIGEDANNRHFGGYVTDINAIEGTAYAASYFGEFKNDIWVPKDPSVTYGTNGFRLQFKSSGVGTASASTIGADTSGNTNHFTSTNIGVHDQVPDSPTNNFATLNSLSTLGTVALTEGNLKVQVGGSNSVDQAFSSFAIPTTGKWYCEVGMTTIASNYSAIGLSAAADGRNTGQLPRHGYLQDGQKIAYSTKSSYGNSFANGDVLSIAIDRDNRKLYFAKNGTYQNSGDPAAGSNAAFTSVTQEYDLQVVVYNATTSGTAGASTFIFNAGQDSSFAGTETAQGNKDAAGKGDFYYAPPSGFKALCAANLPDPVETIDPNEGGSPQDYVQTKLYTGNGESSLDIDLDFSPDWVWIKRRGASQSHVIANKLIGDDIFLSSNGNAAESTDNTKFRNFLTNAFRVGSHDGVNRNSTTYVSWNWKANGSGSSNTDGTINTTATSVAAHGGFSVSTYTGDGNDNVTIGHGLSGTPELVLIKPRNYSDNWVWSWGNGNGMAGLTAQAYMYLNSNNAINADDGRFLANDSDTVNLGTNWNNINKDNSSTYIMYCFRSIDGMQKIGTYVGNENADGTFVYTGFRPAFILIKKLAAGDWGIYDNKRLGYNDDNSVLYPAEDIAEQNQASRKIDLLSNGFKLRTTNVTFNDDSTTLFLAFAEQPFKYANAR